MQLPFLPSVLTAKRPPPQWDPVTPAFSRLSKTACAHPIHTISAIALIASTTYISMMENSLFDRSIVQWGNGSYSRKGSLMDGSVNLTVGPETNWEWTESAGLKGTQPTKQVTLVTLSFPTATDYSSPDPPSYGAAVQLPADDETQMVYAVPNEDLSGFLRSIQEVSTADDSSDGRRRWVMRTGANRSGSVRGLGLVDRVRQGFWNFLELLQNADPLDIAIMFSGYLSMHLTFVSLFLSMRRLGSNFWLAATVLFSSTFAFLFASVVTHKLGVPINVVLLSEGLPFLVVTIGFEKPIILTRAVLDANANHRKRGTGATIQSAVAAAVESNGFQIVRDYAIEILILTLGALSGVQGGLRQFCFLAAWILAFDCVMLFTFFTAILTIKLEIIRIKRHITTVKTLEEDGVASRVAENVARTNDNAEDADEEGTMIFGTKVKDSSLVKFKVLMVSGFVLVNLFNLFTLPYRDNASSTVIAIGPEISIPTVNWTRASKPLDSLLASREPMKVTVLHPIEYELQHSIAYPSGTPRGSVFTTTSDGSELFVDGVGSRVVESILKSLEDPVLSKWIIFALIMSLVLNGYLFNAARWSVKEPMSDRQTNFNSAKTHQPQVVERIVSVNCACGGKAQAPDGDSALDVEKQSSRTIAECEAMLKEKRAAQLTNAELVELGIRGKYPTYSLEKALGDTTRAVMIRRAIVSRTKATADKTSMLERSLLPFRHYDYDRVLGACCENVIGYLPLPLGVAGPLNIDGEDFYIPMATTEGVLTASTHRGAKAINAGGGVVTVLTGDGMTRGPVVKFPGVVRTGAAKNWIESEVGQKKIKQAFDSTSRFARLQAVQCTIGGRLLFIRFKTTTGDAMGMNMISKGVEHALYMMATEFGFEDMTIISVSGNFCTDKKAAAVNWINGRGKSVVAEAIIPARVVKDVLKTSVDAMVELNISKNLIGSAMAGSLGGFNAHAANVVTAIFLATGQDPAQNVESSNCITIMEKTAEGNLAISVSMPSIEVGTIGGGTILEPQGAMLDLLGVRGAHMTNPGDNARKLARIIAAAVLAGELSLCSALAAGHLVRSHMAHNRSQPATRTTTPAPVENGGAALPLGLTITNMNANARGVTN